MKPIDLKTSSSCQGLGKKFFIQWSLENWHLDNWERLKMTDVGLQSRFLENFNKTLGFVLISLSDIKVCVSLLYTCKNLVQTIVYAVKLTGISFFVFVYWTVSYSSSVWTWVECVCLWAHWPDQFSVFILDTARNVGAIQENVWLLQYAKYNAKVPCSYTTHGLVHWENNNICQPTIPDTFLH